ncbi:GNAT family N-acetyltransferase [Microbulbifer sp. TRSA001]|uniref:GNAT family N-acetyltransferase n=1 Tax=unclassified Microbulbifer TaxID=2619833 RepID=UPI0024AC8AE0|nr:N-acetyltransferase [Microbulbifer sp. VAAF005]WHI45934.1 N-acetyltransferase [Microbulbifer sp. VAAF005]
MAAVSIRAPTNSETMISMIINLDILNEEIANQVFIIFQRSYKVEAQLIGVTDFPPLSRSAQDIKNSKSLFYGFIDKKCLAAIIEITIEGKRLEINSLTVDPNHFRKGIAGKLLSYILDEIEFSEAIVETATKNDPAINLYEKYGFVEFKRWTPPHGIQKVALSLENSL